MFERFGHDARLVVVSAQEDARVLRHHHIGSEHLLLALARVDHGIVSDTFRALDLTLDQLRDAVADLVPPGDDAPHGHIAFNDEAKRVLEGSLREALRREDASIEPEHQLLALAGDGGSVACRVLEVRGVKPAAVAAKVEELRRAIVLRSRGDRRAARALGRSGSMAMLQGFGPGRRPEPRCVLCGRDEDRCEHVLVAGGVRLCSDCVRAAVAQLDALPPEAPKLVRYRRPEHAPRDREAAIAAIEAAFDAVFSPLQLPVDEALGSIEGGERARGLLETLREGSAGAPMVPSDQTVERVRFLDEDDAEVSYGLWMPGSQQPMLFPVHAVREDGTWKVARSAVEHFANLAQQFRPRPAP